MYIVVPIHPAITLVLGYVFSRILPAGQEQRKNRCLVKAPRQLLQQWARTRVNALFQAPETAQRSLVIEGDYEQTTLFDQGRGLRNCCPHVARVVKHPPAINDVVLAERARV